MIRFFVCSGRERAAWELFSAAETVPAVSPRCSAMVFSVTLSEPRGPALFFCRGVIRGSLDHLPKLGYGLGSAQALDCLPPAARYPVSRHSSSTWVAPDKLSMHWIRASSHSSLTRPATK